VGFFRQSFGPRGEKFGAHEPVAIVEMACELRSCNDSVVDPGGELFAKLGQLLGKWRIIRAAKADVFVGPSVVVEMGVANKSSWIRPFVAPSAQSRREVTAGKRPRFQRSPVPLRR